MKIRKVLKIFEWVVFLILFVLVLLVLSPLLPTKEYISTHIVSTGSMEPAINTGSIAFSTLKSEEINKGDIIVFSSPENSEITIIHRVKDIQGEEYITKGDNNESEDNWTVFQSNIKGEVLFSISYLGYAVEWMKTTTGFITLLVLPGLILAILQFIKIREGINDEVEKRTTEELTKRNI